MKWMDFHIQGYTDPLIVFPVSLFAWSCVFRRPRVRPAWSGFSAARAIEPDGTWHGYRLATGEGGGQRVVPIDRSRVALDSACFDWERGAGRESPLRSCLGGYCVRLVALWPFSSRGRHCMLLQCCASLYSVMELMEEEEGEGVVDVAQGGDSLSDLLDEDSMLSTSGDKHRSEAGYLLAIVMLPPCGCGVHQLPRSVKDIVADTYIDLGPAGKVAKLAPGQSVAKTQYRRLQCLFCDKEFNCNVTRFRSHVFGSRARVANAFAKECVPLKGRGKQRNDLIAEFLNAVESVESAGGQATAAREAESAVVPERMKTLVPSRVFIRNNLFW